MTAKEFYYKCVDELSFTDDAKFEALCMFESMLNIDKTALVTNITIKHRPNHREHFFGKRWICWEFFVSETYKNPMTKI